MKKIIKIWFAAFLLLAAISCKKEYTNSPSPSTKKTSGVAVTKTIAHYIGESYGGGIIFLLNSAGQHGLIAAVQDQDASAWYNNEILTITGATGERIGTGPGNTRKIITSQGRPGNYAALKCAHYTGGGFTDWFLPSKNELNELNKKRDVVGGFKNSAYWSSTEYSLTEAWHQLFPSGFQLTENKLTNLRVRAIRAF